jgi:serine/threonine protein kinase
MAEIFLGFAHAGTFSGQPVVLKRILTEQREDVSALRMLIDEAKLTATLIHPNVAKIVDLEAAEDEVILVIEFIAGANLEELAELCGKLPEGLPLGFVLTAVRDAAQGLAHAHAHRTPEGVLLPVVHRDVTPRNVMVDFEGAFKMLDFGIARTRVSERRTQVGMVRGTTAYMSPEQAVGKELDPRSDLFSLGIVFHELLCGQRLFQRSNPGQEMGAVYEGVILPPSKVNRRVPRSLDAVVMGLLERKLERRFQSANSFIDQFDAQVGVLRWSHEQCASLVADRCADRRKEIDQMLALIPKRSPAAAPRRLSKESRAKSGSPKSDDLMATWRVQPSPRDSSASLNPTDSGLETRTESLSPTAIYGSSSGDTSTGLETTLANFDRTEISPPGNFETEVQTVPSGRTVSSRVRGGKRLALVAAGLVAMAVGAIAGGVLYRVLFDAEPISYGQLRITADRPAELIVGGQTVGAVGQSPLQTVLPTGHHALWLKDSTGVVRIVEVDVKADAPSSYTLTLDTLRKLP